MQAEPVKLMLCEKTDDQIIEYRLSQSCFNIITVFTSQNSKDRRNWCKYHYACHNLDSFYQVWFTHL